jgi:hypothetical protein
MRLQTLMVCVAILATSTVFSQPLDIIIDITKNKVTYIADQDTIKQPVVKRGEAITVHLVNYNNYLYDVEIQESQSQTFYQSTGMDTSQMFNIGDGSSGSGSAMNIFSMFTGASGMFGLDMLAQGQLPLIGGLSFGGKGFADDAVELRVSEQLSGIRTDYEKTLEELMAIEGSITAISEEIEQVVGIKKKQDVAIKEIQQIRFNPRMAPHRIKQLSTEYMEMIFGDTDITQLSAQDLWELSRFNERIGESLKFAQEEKEAYETKLQDLEFYAVSLTQVGIDQVTSSSLTKNYVALENSLVKTFGEAQQVLQNLDENMGKMEEALAENKDGDFERLSRLRYMYEELNQNDFTYTYTTTARDDMTTLEVLLQPKEELPEGISAKSRKIAAVQVQSKGGLKLNASLGLSFGQFFNQPQSYFIRDSVILAQDEDSFVPVLTSFLHFYGYRPGQVSYGGSFGVGLPVFSDQPGQSISFFLGPSVFLGGAQRIVLTGGLMGGRVNVLSRGYKVGDVLAPTEFTVPTGMKYRLGYFVGMSINIAGG